MDCAKVFVDDMIKLYESVSHYFAINKPLKMSKQEEIDFKNATNCHICGRSFTRQIIKAKDHTHTTGNSKIVN